MNLARGIGKFLLAIPAAYFGGNIIFGFFIEDSILTYVLLLFREPVQEFALIALLWITRAMVFFALVMTWIFLAPERSTPKSVDKL